MKKPKFLYHGSPHKNLDQLKPQNRLLHRAEEDKLIYATPDIALASVFLASGKAHIGCGKFGKVWYIWIIADRNKFIKNDSGGHIYVLPSETFKVNQKSVFSEEEYVSTVPVKPNKVIEFTSSIDALVENDVQVYFISQEIYEQVQKSKDHGYLIFCNLESENQRRGVNVKKL